MQRERSPAVEHEIDADGQLPSLIAVPNSLEERTLSATVELPLVKASRGHHPARRSSVQQGTATQPHSELGARECNAGRYPPVPGGAFRRYWRARRAGYATDAQDHVSGNLGVDLGSARRPAADAGTPGTRHAECIAMVNCRRYASPKTIGQIRPAQEPSSPLSSDRRRRWDPRVP
jgi:hypothetical protein